MTENTSQSGFNIIEVVVYAGLLAAIITTITAFATTIIERSTHTHLQASILDNARGAVSVMAHDIREASGVYTPTSVLETNPGQLSITNIHDAPTGEDEDYIDFYIEDGQLYRKRDGTDATAITSDAVTVSNLSFTYLQQSSTSPAVQIQITVEPKDASMKAEEQSDVSLITTVSLRVY